MDDTDDVTSAGENLRLLKNLSERSLMELWVKERDEEAVVELIARFEDALYAFLKSQTSESTAWDIYQELMLKILYLPDTDYQAIQNPKSWLFKVAVNLVRDHWREKKRRPAMELKVDLISCGVDGAHRAHDDKEIAARLRNALAELSEPERQAFVLVRLSELSYQDAADALGIQLSALKMRLMRAHQHLTEMLDDLKQE